MKTKELLKEWIEGIASIFAYPIMIAWPAIIFFALLILFVVWLSGKGTWIDY